MGRTWRSGGYARRRRPGAGRWRSYLLMAATVLAVGSLASRAAHAQRASEDAVAQAEDAFGMAVGRQAIGLYSSGSARGFSPLQAGNLRIDGLYYDQVPGFFTNLPTRLERSSAVHVGIAAQGYLFPAPTGVVDYQLRSPGNEAVLSTLNGLSNYGVYYDETDFSLPVIRDRLSFGGGIGYSHNSAVAYSKSGAEWTAGGLIRWQPTDSLVITPFWGLTHHIEYGEKPYYVYLDNSGVPRYRSVNMGSQPWADWSSISQNFGTTARMALGDGWVLAAGIFRSTTYMPVTYNPFLSDVGESNQGEYGILAVPANSSGSTSGEVRLAKLFGGKALRNTVYLRLTGRQSSVESGGSDFVDIGPGSTTYSPYAHPSFSLGPLTDVQSRQWTPGVAYRGVWRDKLQLTLGVQKVFYHRLVLQPPPEPSISYSTSPWLFSAAVSGSVTQKLLLYSSYTRGFENIATAPLNASNANEPVPSVLTWQVDGGLRYQLLAKLQLVAGVFEIDKPFFNIDQSNLYRMLGTTRNRGAEFSLTGDLTRHLNVVSGIVLLQPRVRYTAGALAGSKEVVVIGPVPGYMNTYLQYRPERFPGLTLGASVKVLSSRYAIYPSINLPANASVGADARYATKLMGHSATFWLQMTNLTDIYSLSPSPNRAVQSLDARKYEFSLVVDF